MLTTLLAALTIVFPLFFLIARDWLSTAQLAAVLAVLLALRAVTLKHRVWAGAAALGVGLCVLAAVFNQPIGLKLYPVLINFVLLVVFGSSLLRPPSVVERLARFKEPNLPPAGVQYTRRVTQVWCLFFTGNGLVAGYTAAYSSDRAWALYNGLISYCLMAALFAVEWLVRQKVRTTQSPTRE